MDSVVSRPRIYFLLSLIVLFIALFLRTWQLNSYPVSLSIDEVGIGYNAYSILKTGKDEWGQSFPLAFKSVGDYKPPVDMYLTVPFIAVLGLNEWAVRLPVAIIGALTCLVFIFLLKELKISGIGSLMGGLWLAILPWHIHFSRGSFEAVTALFFMVLGAWMFLRSRQKFYPYFIFSIICFSLSVWSYHSERFFVPLLVIFLVFYFREKIISGIKKDIRLSTLALIIFLLFAVPFIDLTIFTDAIKTRALSTSILREQSLIITLHNHGYKNWQDLVFNNDIYLIFRHWAGKYINYFDLRFWFWKGLQFTPPGYPDLGLMYLIDIPVFLSGIYALTKSKNSFLKALTLFFLFVGPLPASFTMNEQHPLRALTWIPFFGMVMAVGFEWIAAQKFHFKKTAVAVYGILLVFSLLYFHDIYFYQFPKFYSEYWQYGYKEMSLYACENRNNYKEIAIAETFGTDGPLNTGTPYLYYLFYCKYDPVAFLENRLANNTTSAGNVVFRRPDLFSDFKKSNNLLIASPWDLPLEKIPEENILKKVYFKNGVLGFLAVKTSD